MPGILTRRALAVMLLARLIFRLLTGNLIAMVRSAFASVGPPMERISVFFIKTMVLQIGNFRARLGLIAIVRCGQLLRRRLVFRLFPLMLVTMVVRLSGRAMVFVK